MADKTKDGEIVILEYVNMPDGTTREPDLAFNALEWLAEYVDQHYRGWSSYSVMIVAAHAPNPRRATLRVVK